MARFRKHDELTELETRLRDERPEPSEELIRRVASDVRPEVRRAPMPRMRLATALSVGLLTAMAGAAVASHEFGHEPPPPAQENYATIVNVCHRTDDRGYEQLRLPPQGAVWHLENHQPPTHVPGDYPGTCVYEGPDPDPAP